MKKNVMMRAASALLVAVLLTTCAISGTFAKYTTSATGSDSARVAYWGWEPATMSLTGLFSNTYDGTVTGEDGDDVIAPGTTGSAKFAFAFGGITGDAAVDTVAQGITAPEVKYSFEVKVDGSCDEAIKNNPNILWNLDGGTFGSWDDMIAGIKALSGSDTGKKEYAAGDLPDAFTATDDEHTISWKWIFDEKAANAEAGTGNNDTNDTAMGNKTTLDDCSITITITATQID